MIVAFLLMIAGGVGLACAASDPRQVTLRWLRLGGILTVTLTISGATVDAITRTGAVSWPRLGCQGAVAVVFAAQLLAVQQGRRIAQRVAAWAGFLMAAMLAWALAVSAMGDGPRGASLMAAVTSFALASGLLGGFLMTMLLGHAYLTAGGEMSQRPFRRLVLLLAALLIARTAGSLLFGLIPYWRADSDVTAMERMWDQVMIAARYLVGLVIPGVMIYMTHDCVQRRANQSATGILYVAIVMVILGEGAAMGLMRGNGLMW